MVDTVTVATNDPFIGSYLSSVRVERVIGRGGMAIVYGGVDETLNRRVAIKVISTAHQEKKAYAERFKKEAQLVATWDHPNIIQIYSAGQYGAYYYFIMRFIEGLDLRQLIDQYMSVGQLVPIKDVLSIGRSVADALDYAHKRGSSIGISNHPM
jgi:serine/threonine protein kinase